MIKNTSLAGEASGTPLSHAECFQQVANQIDCVIASRSVGKWATSLILENYASKGFHVKTKSCNWGPMAGFVLADPRFSKKGKSGVGSQENATKKAIAHGAKLTAVCISDSRLGIIERELKTIKVISREDNKIKVSPTDGRFNELVFILVKDQFSPRVEGLGTLWRVCYDATVKPQGPRNAGAHFIRQKLESGLESVYALTNPGTNNLSYKSALTGDYDLWGVYPRSSDYQPDGQDKRMVPGSNYGIKTFKFFEEHEDEHQGNMTQRIRGIKDLLNNAFMSAGYTGGNMVHHSDELGRPFGSPEEVELEFIAFFPQKNGAAVFVNSLGEFQQFESLVRNAGYKDLYNPNWVRFHNYNNVLDEINKKRHLHGQSKEYNR